MAEVGTSKIRGGGTGLHNKPAGCGSSEAYAPGPDREEEEEDCPSSGVLILYSQQLVFFHTGYVECLLARSLAGSQHTSMTNTSCCE